MSAEVCVACGREGLFTKSMKRRLPLGQRKCTACSTASSPSSSSLSASAAAASSSSSFSISSATPSSKSTSKPLTKPKQEEAPQKNSKAEDRKTESSNSRNSRERVEQKDKKESVVDADDNFNNMTFYNRKTKSKEVIKSPADTREYRALKLDNNMEVLLISDEKEEGSGMAYVALSVRVGYFSDPPHVPGLAHFCEHMLFLGTKDFPNENEWEEFLATNGGDSNASTDCEITVFQYEISFAHLQESLKRFSSFFTCPLFKTSGVKREIRAVDSEFKDDLQSNAHRSGEVLMESCFPEHPFHKFGWGNLATLETIPKEKKIDVRAELLKFHKQHYSAHAMKLVIHGKNLNQMEDDVLRYFSSVKSTEEKLNDFSSFGNPFPPSSLMHTYNIVSTKESRLSLSLTWSLPSLFAYYETSPMEYVNSLLGHEGVGSVLSLLKVKGWAVALEAGCSEGDGEAMNTAFWLESIEITLSELGFEHRMEVIGIVFQYIRMLKEKKVQKWYWDELKHINEASFRFLEKSDPLDYVEDLARCLHFYPIEECLSSILLTKYDEKIISEIIDLLTPERARVDVLSSNFREKSNCMTTWFRTPFFKQPISKEILDRWREGPIDERLSFPTVNPFVPLDFSIKTEEAKKKSKSTQPKNGVHVPTQIVNERFGTVWHLLDTHFSLPKARVMISMQSPLLYSSAHNHACAVLVSDVLNDWLTHHTYPASMAGLNFSAHHSRNSLEVSFRGFSHKLLTLTETVFTHISELASVLTTDEYIQQRFSTNRELAAKEYNTLMYTPSTQTKYGRQIIVNEKQIFVEETAEMLKTITIAQVQIFLKSFLKHMYVTMFVHGNMNKKESVDLWEKMKRILHWEVLNKKPKELALEIKKGENVYILTQTRNPKESNSAIEVYYQIGEGTMETRCYLLLLNHLLWEACFDQLRTKEQLGYQVSSGVRTTVSNIYAFIIAIQSEAYSPNFLDWRIEKFVRKFRRRLSKMSKPQYKKSVLGLITEMSRPDNNLSEITNRIWNEICEQTLNFQRLAQQIACIRDIKHADILRFYDQYILGYNAESKQFNTNRAKLASCVFGFGYKPAAPSDSQIGLETSLAPASSVSSTTVANEVTAATAESIHPHVHCSSHHPHHGHRSMWSGDVNFHREVIDEEVIARFHERKDLDDEGDEGESDEGDDDSEEDEGDESESDEEGEEKYNMAELQDLSTVRIIQSHTELLAYKSKLRAYPPVSLQNLDVLS